MKMKYKLGVWRTMPSYPTEEDVLYDIGSVLPATEARLDAVVAVWRDPPWQARFDTLVAAGRVAWQDGTIVVK